jgi:predicted nucleic-acid-binding protein
MTDYHRLADRDRIRIHAESKHEKIKAEAIDILIDVLHRQMSSGGTVSFDHNLARKIEKLINRGMTRAR